MSQKEAFDQFLKQLDEAVKEAKRAIKLPLIPDQKTGRLLWISNRELTLRYAISVDSNKKFYEGLTQGKILATRCPSCNTIYFPPQNYCNKCNKQDLNWIELSGKGELLSYTKVVVKPYSFSHLQDYVVGIAKLKEGINILAWVSETDVTKLKRGMKITLRVNERPQEGYLVYEIVPEES